VTGKTLSTYGARISGCPLRSWDWLAHASGQRLEFKKDRRSEVLQGSPKHVSMTRWPGYGNGWPVVRSSREVQSA